MRNFYFDYQIFETDCFDNAERILRLNLQRDVTAREALTELGDIGFFANRVLFEDKIKNRAERVLAYAQ